METKCQSIEESRTAKRERERTSQDYEVKHHQNEKNSYIQVDIVALAHIKLH